MDSAHDSGCGRQHSFHLPDLCHVGLLLLKKNQCSPRNAFGFCENWKCVFLRLWAGLLRPGEAMRIAFQGLRNAPPDAPQV